MMRSLRRALRLGSGRAGLGIRAVPVVAVLLVVGLFVTTMGWTILWQEAGPLTALAMPEAGASVIAAMGVFMGSVLGGILALWLLAGLAYALGRRPRRASAK